MVEEEGKEVIEMGILILGLKIRVLNLCCSTVLEIQLGYCASDISGI